MRLFVGHTYINVTFLTDNIPIGDEKHVRSEYAISFGGNAGLAPARQIHRKSESRAKRHVLEWGGVRLRIDQQQDPALLFRCLT